MSGYDFGSPFKTPSKSKPAIVYQEISDLSFTNHFIEMEEEEIPDEEIAQVDAMLDLHDTDEDEDLIHEKSTLFDEDEEIPDRYHTPCFTPRKAAFIARRESQSTTVIELTKLVNQMKEDSDGAKSTNSKISTILLIVVVLVAILFASSNRPYCNVYDNQVCIRNDSTGVLSYKLANIAKDYLEQLAYRVDCLGNSKISKKVQRDKLLDLVIDKSLSEYSQNRPDTTYTHAFNTMISVFVDNEDVFKIALESDNTFISSRFQSLGSCFITKYHLKPYTSPAQVEAVSTTPSVEETKPETTHCTSDYEEGFLGNILRDFNMFKGMFISLLKGENYVLPCNVCGIRDEMKNTTPEQVTEPTNVSETTSNVNKVEQQETIPEQTNTQASGEEKNVETTETSNVEQSPTNAPEQVETESTTPSTEETQPETPISQTVDETTSTTESSDDTF